MKYFLAVLFAFICATVWYFKDRLLLSPRDAYYAALVRENLDAVAARWRIEAEQSLAAPLSITLPYSERRLLDAASSQAVTFKVNLKADQLLQIDIFPSPNTHAQMFVDVFLLDDVNQTPKALGEMETNENQLTLSADQSGQYLVRIQSAHMALGLIDLAITSPMRYGFPVDTQRENAVQSFFGVARDGGARRHEGIDIFAPRGTPVIAAEAGLVSRVGDTPRGGKNVWVSGDRRSFYYAHLDSIAVAAGERVARGEVLGTVGNTGNAVTTSPHLHFGIYKFAQGAVDPLPLVGRKKARAAFTPPAVELAPRWVTITSDSVNLRSEPSVKSNALDLLTNAELLHVDAVAGDWLRVTTGKGTKGFIARRLTRTPSESAYTLTHNQIIFSSPQETAPIIGNFSAGEKLSTFGKFGDFTWVKLPGGFYGWTKEQKASELTSN